MNPDRTLARPCPLLSRICLATAALALPLAAADVFMIAVLKGQRFIQDSQGIVAMDTRSDGDSGVGFRSMVEEDALGSVLSATLQGPAGAATTLRREYADEPALQHEQDYDSLLDLTHERPDGNYTVTLATRNDGPKSLTLALTGSAWPPVPRITNHTTLQSATATSPITVQWQSMGGTTDDYIFLQIVNPIYGNPVFESGAPGEPGALNGTSTSLVIPANTLEVGHRYRAELLFLRVASVDRSYTTAVAGYSKSVSFDLVTKPQTGLRTDAAFDHAVPADFTSWVPVDSAVAFHFTRPMASNRAVTWTIDGTPTSAFAYEWIEGGSTLLCKPSAPLPADAEVAWRLDLSGFRDDAGVALFAGTDPERFVEGSFTTDPDGQPVSPMLDVNAGYVVKSRAFTQSGPTPVARNVHTLLTGAELGAYNRLRGGTLTVASTGSIATFGHDPWYPAATFEGEYASKADLDRFFPNGNYILTVDTLANGLKTVTLGLGATDDYPAAPTVANLAAMTGVDPKAPLTIQWNALAGSQNPWTVGGGLIELEILTRSGSDVFWADNGGNGPALGDTSFTLPAGTLWPGRTYEATLSFTRMKDIDIDAYPDSFFAAGFRSSTRFLITTAGTPSMPTLRVVHQPWGTDLTASGGEPSSSYVLESSPDLARWLPQATLWVGDGNSSSNHFDADAAYLKSRFYRLRDRLPDENPAPVVSIQGTVWSNASRLVPVAGAVVGTSLDGRSTVTDEAGRFFLETDADSWRTPGGYTITVNSAGRTWSFPGTWGSMPRDQNLELGN